MGKADFLKALRAKTLQRLGDSVATGKEKVRSFSNRFSQQKENIVVENTIDLKENIGGAPAGPARSYPRSSSNDSSIPSWVDQFLYWFDRIDFVGDLFGIFAGPLYAIWDFLNLFAVGLRVKYYGFSLKLLLEFVPIVGAWFWLSEGISRPGNHASPGSGRNRLDIFLNQGKEHALTIGKVLFILLFIFIGLTFALPYLYNINIIPPNVMESITTGIAQFGMAFYEWIGKLSPANVVKVWGDFFSRQMSIATGGYYEGRVDENRRDGMQLGITFEEFKPERPKFYEGEEAKLWGRIVGRALEWDDADKVIPVKTWCEYVQPITHKKIIASENLMQIDGWGDEYFDCAFNTADLGAGAKYIDGYVKFDFTTKAYLRTYFMEDSRIKEYKKLGKNPLAEFGIYDQHPLAVYTNGPVKLAIGTNEEFPLRVKESGSPSTLFGITIDNRYYVNGYIEKIKEIRAQLPAALSFDTAHCDFNPVPLQQINDPLLGETYTVYRLEIPQSKRLENIDKFLTLNCKVNIPNANAFLRNKPLAVVFFRAEVDYTYVMKKRAMIMVQKEEATS